MTLSRLISYLPALSPSEAMELAMAAAERAGMSKAAQVHYRRALEVGVEYREMQGQVRK